MFITFEGIDLSGKSTQAKLLYEFLKKKKIKSLLVREPGGTEISERIRDILLDKDLSKMYALTEFLLFSASRHQLTEEVIKPALKKKIIVICDRYYDSSTAYQGYGGKVNLKDILFINKKATSGLVPDLTFLVTVSMKTAESRRKKTGKPHDRMEQKRKDYFQKVDKGFKKLAKKEKDRFIVLNGELPKEEVHNKIKTIISNKLNIK